MNGQVKESFQTWDCRKLVFIFDNVEMITSSHSIYGDIGEFKVDNSTTKLKKYIFYSAWYDENRDNKEVLLIEAEKMEIFQVGMNAEINSAVFDVGYEYVGDQKCPYSE